MNATPGPWFFEPHNLYGGTDFDGRPWPFGYVSCWTPNRVPLPIFALAPLFETPSEELEELDANARLIAAAPDLLACLKETLAVATRNEEGDFADRARAAIAKARARS